MLPLKQYSDDLSVMRFLAATQHNVTEIGEALPAKNNDIDYYTVKRHNCGNM
jgi:hypothetical protein